MVRDNLLEKIGKLHWILSLVAGLGLGASLIFMSMYASSLPLPMALLIIIALAMMIPEAYDIYLAHMYPDVKGDPSGVDGLGRVLMTFGIILVIGAAVFQLLTISSTSLETLPTNFSSLGSQLIFSNTTSNATSQVEMDKMIDIISKNNQAVIDTNKTFVDTVKTILIALGGAITTIIGFYFGQRGAEPEPAEAKAAEGKAAEGKAAEGKAAEGKAVETKAVETKAVETKADEGKGTHTKKQGA